MTSPILVLSFTDVLCGYCYVADARLARLKARFGRDVQLSVHFFSVYGDVQRRMGRRAIGRQGYAEMAHALLRRHPHVEVHPGVFREQVPASSTPAHLYLRAVKLLQDQGALATADGPSPFDRLLWALRLAFFRDLRDISQRQVLEDVAAELGLPPDRVGRIHDDGRAFAELAHDGELQREHEVRVTPSLVLPGSPALSLIRTEDRELEARIEALLEGSVGGEEARQG